MHDNREHEKSSRVVAFLNRQEIDFLDKVGKDALFSTGTKLTRTRLIAWLIDFLRSLNVSGMDLRSEKDLEYRIREVLHASAPPATPACRPSSNEAGREGSNPASCSNGGKK